MRCAGSGKHTTCGTAEGQGVVRPDSAARYPLGQEAIAAGAHPAALRQVQTGPRPLLQVARGRLGVDDLGDGQCVQRTRQPPQLHAELLLLRAAPERLVDAEARHRLPASGPTDR